MKGLVGMVNGELSAPLHLRRIPEIAPAQRARHRSQRAVMPASVVVKYRLTRATRSAQDAAFNAANPRSRSALRSSRLSSPICSRNVGPPGDHLVAVR